MRHSLKPPGQGWENTWNESGGAAAPTTDPWEQHRCCRGLSHWDGELQCLSFHRFHIPNKPDLDKQ